jgi:ParB family chromosome partitioning protein
MTVVTTRQRLKSLSPGEIRANPENPRLVFRQEEMESLMRSIDRHGVQVPVAVYEDGGFYTLIDGERRWRCASKLNLKAIPALIQDKPSELQNLVLMYNIHALREQWDYYTIASKLERVIELYLAENGVRPNEALLSELTGLTRGSIRRCQLLLDLPSRFKTLLLEELDKPKAQQRLSEDFFIEMEKALKTVVRRIPDYGPSLNAIRDTLVEKFRSNTISAVTDFRQLSKIATAIDSLGVAQKSARRTLDRVFDGSNKYSIKQAYEATVEFEYVERKALNQVASLNGFFDEIIQEERGDELDEELRKQLTVLYQRLRRILGK